jgi:2,3-bisphosphoglycerate-independent phosphoglycerate mutase
LNNLIILLDGAADDDIPEFGGRTPLESFEKPFMDMVASNGCIGWTEGREYTHLYLLELLTGQPLNTPRGLVEAVGLGVPVDPHQVAYRFSPAYMYESKVDWAYRVTPELSSSLQDAMVRSLDMLGDLNPRLYFYEDGRGVMTVDTDEVVPFPMPPAPVSDPAFPMHHFDDYIRKVASEMDGDTVGRRLALQARRAQGHPGSKEHGHDLQEPFGAGGRRPSQHPPRRGGQHVERVPGGVPPAALGRRVHAC